MRRRCWHGVGLWLGALFLYRGWLIVVLALVRCEIGPGFFVTVPWLVGRSAGNPPAFFSRGELSSEVQQVMRKDLIGGGPIQTFSWS